MLSSSGSRTGNRTRCDRERSRKSPAPVAHPSECAQTRPRHIRQAISLAIPAPKQKIRTSTGSCSSCMLLRVRDITSGSTTVLNQEVRGDGQPACGGADHVAEIAETVVIGVSGDGWVESDPIPGHQVRQLGTDGRLRPRSLASAAGSHRKSRSPHESSLRTPSTQASGGPAGYLQRMRREKVASILPAAIDRGQPQSSQAGVSVLMQTRLPRPASASAATTLTATFMAR